jgi:hypothetical protein
MSFNSYPSADCSLIEHWAQEAEGKRAGSRGGERLIFILPLSLTPCPLPPTLRLLLLTASQYHQKTLPTQRVVLVNVSIGEDDNISKNE